MKDFELLSIANNWDKNFDRSREEVIRRKLAEFNKHYIIGRIGSIKREDYVYGRYFGDNKKTFCYFMEKELSDFGHIAGSPCSQYGVWYGTHGKDKNVEYRNTNKYGANVGDAMENLRNLITQLHSFGQQKNFEAIAKSKIANKFKGKILATYFPDSYLSIYADDYLDDILKYFNLDDQEINRLAPVYKQNKLLKWKEDNVAMKPWSLIKFAMFLNQELYDNFYNDQKPKEELVPNFPDSSLVTPIEICEEIHEDSDYSPPKIKQHDKPFMDYLKSSIRNKAIGNRGEKIVFDLETRRVAGYAKCKGKIVDWVSKKTDGFGFDIVSYNEDGDEIQIEVKSSVRPFGRAEFFLSDFEYQIAELQSNYQIYYVFDVESKNPIVWKITRPFHPKRKGIHIVPCAYKVLIDPIK